MDIPYIVEGGLPIHKISEAEQRGYMATLTVEERGDVIAHANALAMRIHAVSSARADLRSRSRDLLKMNSNSTPEQRTERFKELGDLRDQYEAMAQDIERMKATVYTKAKGKELVIPPIAPPKAAS